MTKVKATTKKTPTQARQAPQVTAEDRYRMIAEAAYYRAEKRGFTGGDVADDWVQAEAEIERLLSQSVKDGGTAPPTQEIEQQVQAAFSSEVAEISDRVKAIVIQALSMGVMDKEAIKQVMYAVVKGAKDGAAARAENGAQLLTEALHGLDAGLAAVAEAIQLAIHEAASRADEFSQQGLQRAVDDLAAVESLFIEVLGKAAREASGVAREILQDMAEHARASGTALGGRVETALAQLARTLADTARTQAKAGVQAVRDESALLAGLAAGILKGIAERLQAAPAASKKTAAKKGK